MHRATTLDTAWGELLSLIPPPLGGWLERADLRFLNTMEELRIRALRPTVAYGPDWYRFLGPGGFSPSPEGCPPTSPAAVETLVELLADRSLYARETELAQGYLTLPGGHRVGLAGRAVVSAGTVTTTRNWTGINLRVARRLDGVATPLMTGWEGPPRGVPPGVLVVGPPRSGKTTVMRDAIRQLSLRHLRTVVVDERHELAGPAGDGDWHVDVLAGWPKAAGLETAVRVLGPDVVVVDELGARGDAEAVRLARRSGVAVWATAHGAGQRDVERHPVLGRLLREHLFDRVVSLSGDGRHAIAAIWPSP
jgi:stage III sporulation protein AA